MDIDYTEIAQAQLENDYMQRRVDGSANTSMELEELPVGDSLNRIMHDTSISLAQPIIPRNFRKLIFDKIHNMSHPGIKGTRKLFNVVSFGMK